MEAMIREYLTTILRNLATPLIAYLAATGYISDDQATNLIVAAIAVAISVVWGMANKYLWKRTAQEALRLPSTNSPAKLNDVIAGR